MAEDLGTTMYLHNIEACGNHFRTTTLFLLTKLTVLLLIFQTKLILLASINALISFNACFGKFDATVPKLM